jgi:hypothetical protein
MRGLKPLIGVFLLFVAFGNAWATTDEEIFRDFRFNFINPGARSQGLGGAFIAAADDATAIGANPAALHYVSRYEVFLEYRSVEELSRVDTGSFGDASPGSAVDFFDFTTLFSAEDANIPSFASFAIPFRVGKKDRRARVAFSRQVVLDQNNVISTVDPIAFRSDPSLCAPGSGGSCTTLDYSLTTFPLIVTNGAGGPMVERYAISNSVAGLLESELIHYNVGFSMSITNDFSIGVTATLADLTVKSDVTSITDDPRGLISSVHPRVDVGGVLSDIRRATSIDDSDSDMTYTIGLHWHPDSIFPSGLSPIRFGVVYRAGAELAVNQDTLEYNASSAMPGFEVINSFDNIFRVPDRWGVGAVWVGQHWKYSLDIERILYSDQLDDFRTGENFFTSGAIQDLGLDHNDMVFTVDDATVPHFGAEYFFTSGGGKWTQAIRGGYYREADNRIRLERIDNYPFPDREAFFLDLFKGGEDVDHFTVGFSIGTPSGIELQFAGDFSDSNDQLVGSAIYRFGSRR